MIMRCRLKKILFIGEEEKMYSFGGLRWIRRTLEYKDICMNNKIVVNLMQTRWTTKGNLVGNYRKDDSEKLMRKEKMGSRDGGGKGPLNIRWAPDHAAILLFVDMTVIGASLPIIQEPPGNRTTACVWWSSNVYCQ